LILTWIYHGSTLLGILGVLRDRAREEGVMKLYTGPLSLFSAKVRIALAEKGLEYDHASVGWSREDRYLPHHPDVVAHNPKRQVPVLIDGEIVVCDSTLILEYLEENFPEVPLLPTKPAERARARRFEWMADEVVFPPTWDLIEEVFYPAEGERNPQRADAARAALAVVHVDLDRELGERDYFCGAYSVADLALYVMLQAASTLGAPPAAELGRLRAWFERTGARPAVRRDTEAMRAAVADLLKPATENRRAS
jgi:glutathione S-transferase